MNKKIILYFIAVIITTSFVIVYMNSSIGNPIFPEKYISKVQYTKSADVDKETIFNAMADVENYPNVLPDNFLAIKIINQTDNIIFAEEEVIERGIKTKLIVKHTIVPFESHNLEIMNSYAKGTLVTVKYKETNSYTKIVVDAEMHFSGILIPFALLPSNNIHHAVDTVVTSFIKYVNEN